MLHAYRTIAPEGKSMGLAGLQEFRTFWENIAQ